MNKFAQRIEKLRVFFDEAGIEIPFKQVDVHIR